jgi:hypothetical protein
VKKENSKKQKPTLTLINPTGITGAELAEFVEGITGKKPTQAEIDECDQILAEGDKNTTPEHKALIQTLLKRKV